MDRRWAMGGLRGGLTVLLASIGATIGGVAGALVAVGIVGQYGTSVAAPDPRLGPEPEPLPTVARVLGSLAFFAFTTCGLLAAQMPIVAILATERRTTGRAALAVVGVLAFALFAGGGVWLSPVPIDDRLVATAVSVVAAGVVAGGGAMRPPTPAP